jgi:hypothetical protein
MKRGDVKFEQSVKMVFWCLVGSPYVVGVTLFWIDGFNISTVALFVLWTWMYTWLLRDWVLPHKRKILDFLGRILER